MAEKNEHDENVIEVDFSKMPDRYSEHLAFDGGPGGDEQPENEIEVPPYWESEKEIHELYSRDSLDKAFKLVNAKRVIPTGREGLYNVEGSDLYVCTIIELEDSVTPGITCTCPNGSNRSGRPTCYHSAAVLMVHTGTDPDTVQMKLAGFPV